MFIAHSLLTIEPDCETELYQWSILEERKAEVEKKTHALLFNTHF